MSSGRYGNARFGTHRGARSAAIDDHRDEHDLGAERPHDVDRLHQRRAPGRRVLGDDDAITRFEGARDPARHAVILRLLADAETAQLAAASGRDRGDAERHRVGAHRQPADRRRVSGDDGEQRIGDQHDAVRSARGLLGVEEPRALRPRLEREVAALDGVREDVGAQRVERGRQRRKRSAAHPPDVARNSSMSNDPSGSFTVR